MKITWTYYPKYEPKVSLLIHYVPQMDRKKQWGFLHVETNQAFVGWECFKAFHRGDLTAKKDAFARLVRISNIELANV